MKKGLLTWRKIWLTWSLKVFGKEFNKMRSPREQLISISWVQQSRSATNRRAIVVIWLRDSLSWGVRALPTSIKQMEDQLLWKGSIVSETLQPRIRRGPRLSRSFQKRSLTSIHTCSKPSVYFLSSNWTNYLEYINGKIKPLPKMTQNVATGRPKIVLLCLGYFSL